ncbi:MAG: hypothetical protein ACYC0V_10175 [Armatimonadota bacterium]
MHNEINAFEDQLNDFSLDRRISALESLASEIRIDVPVKQEVNLHYHTFFSFNANGWSPSRIAWESRKYGLEVAGIVDFDVLDGMDEFLAAGEFLGLKTVAGLETRVFVNELSDKAMSSPNEPGVAYFMASGCYQYPPAGSSARAILDSMALTAKSRNLALISRVNTYLDEVQLDYEADAIPLTPAGNATERHLLTSYDAKARSVFGGDICRIVGFWASKLNLPEADVSVVIDTPAKFHEILRSKLMKFGGVGYIAPNSGSFPSLDDAISMIQGMSAFPMITWLDGTNPGEENADDFLNLMISKGVGSINIIPDRNWNLKNQDEKALKVKKLDEIVKASKSLNLPISVGTEMNKAGLPFVDNFNAPELMPYVKDFVEGAWCIYGHTILARYADFGYFSEGANSMFGDDITAKNAFFTKIGKAGLPIPQTKSVSFAVEKIDLERFIDYAG